MEKMQVNVHTSVDGEVSTSITKYSEDGYVGRLTDTVYCDGSSYTDWCEFVGTKEECEDYIRENY